jgi:excinuclease ABC subunit C
MQDEVHRYTIGYERRSHSKAALKSALEEIPGIGEKRAKALMKACGSPEEIEKLGVDQLAAIDGMNARAAQAVWDHFHT